MNPTEYQTLRQSPLFQLSLASRELFHSNFLAWLFDRHPTWVGPILGTQPGDERWALGPKGSRREERNLDLVLHLEEGITLIVENKVKSVPYRAQLDEYEKKGQSFGGELPKPPLPPPDFGGGRCASQVDVAGADLRPGGRTPAAGSFRISGRLRALAD